MGIRLWWSSEPALVVRSKHCKEGKRCGLYQKRGKQDKSTAGDDTGVRCEHCHAAKWRLKCELHKLGDSSLSAREGMML